MVQWKMALRHMTPTTYFPAAADSIYIGFSATALLLLNGRIAGISDILNGAMESVPGERRLPPSLP